MDGDVDIGGGRLHYRVEGPDDGPPVLLINSLGSTIDLWSAQAAAWSTAFRVIRYDARGHGRSSAPPGEYTIDDLGRDAVRVLDAVGTDRAHVCGISLGGLTAMWIAVHHPSRVRELIVANTAARVGTPARWVDRITRVRGEGMASIADDVVSTWLTPAFRTREPVVAERFRDMIASTNPDGYIGCCAALRDADLRLDLARIRARALVVAGGHDASTTTADAELIRAAIPDATLLVLNAAHLTNVECASSFTRHVGMFLSVAETAVVNRGHSAGDAMRRRILGDAHVDRAARDATPLTRDFQDFITRYVWGEIWTRPGLDERTRRVLVIGTLVALGRWEEFALHVRAAVVEGGFSADDLKEIVLQQAVYCGVPAANHALSVARKVLDEPRG